MNVHVVPFSADKNPDGRESAIYFVLHPEPTGPLLNLREWRYLLWGIFLRWWPLIIISLLIVSGIVGLSSLIYFGVFGMAFYPFYFKDEHHWLNNVPPATREKVATWIKEDEEIQRLLELGVPQETPLYFTLTKNGKGMAPLNEDTKNQLRKAKFTVPPSNTGFLINLSMRSIENKETFIPYFRFVAGLLALHGRGRGSSNIRESLQMNFSQDLSGTLGEVIKALTHHELMTLFLEEKKFLRSALDRIYFLLSWSSQRISKLTRKMEVAIHYALEYFMFFHPYEIQVPDVSAKGRQEFENLYQPRLTSDERHTARQIVLDTLGHMVRKDPEKITPLWHDVDQFQSKYQELLTKFRAAFPEERNHPSERPHDKFTIMFANVSQEMKAKIESIISSDSEIKNLMGLGTFPDKPIVIVVHSFRDFSEVYVINDSLIKEVAPLLGSLKLPQQGFLAILSQESLNDPILIRPTIQKMAISIALLGRGPFSKEAYDALNKKQTGKPDWAARLDLQYALSTYEMLRFLGEEGRFLKTFSEVAAAELEPDDSDSDAEPNDTYHLAWGYALDYLKTILSTEHGMGSPPENLVPILNDNYADLSISERDTTITIVKTSLAEALERQSENQQPAWLDPDIFDNAFKNLTRQMRAHFPKRHPSVNSLPYLILTRYFPLSGWVYFASLAGAVFEGVLAGGIFLGYGFSLPLVYLTLLTTAHVVLEKIHPDSLISAGSPLQKFLTHAFIFSPYLILGYFHFSPLWGLIIHLAYDGMKIQELIHKKRVQKIVSEGLPEKPVNDNNAVAAQVIANLGEIPTKLGMNETVVEISQRAGLEQLVAPIFEWQRNGLEQKRKIIFVNAPENGSLKTEQEIAFALKNLINQHQSEISIDQISTYFPFREGQKGHLSLERILKATHTGAARTHMGLTTRVFSPAAAQIALITTSKNWEALSPDGIFLRDLGMRIPFENIVAFFVNLTKEIPDIVPIDIRLQSTQQTKKAA